MTTPATFEQASHWVAARFLQSVVVVDDRAGYPERTSENSADESTASLSPTIATRSRRRHRKLAIPENAKLSVQDLNAKRLVDGFAELGLVCAVLRPAATENPETKTVLAASRSDIIVLDWNIHNDDGDTTREVVRRILTADGDEKRLRLIAIYTGERNIRDISLQLRRQLREILGGDGLKADGDFASTKNSVRVVVFAKEDTKLISTDENAIERRVNETELTSRLIAEFAKLTSGLVSNVGLRAMAVLRLNTHRLLGRLRPSLDPAYLWHRAVQARPADAEDHLVAIVASELRSLMEDDAISDEASLPFIRLWLQQTGVLDFGSRFGETQPRSIDEVCELLDVGSAGASPASEAIAQKFQKMKRNHAHTRSAALQMFAQSVAGSQRSNEELAVLMSLQTHYSHPPPRLQLGTILVRGRGRSRRYWLCVQPRCDSVRLSESRTFPLLPLTVAKSGKFNLLIPKKRGNYVRLSVKHSPYSIRMVQFRRMANDNDAVIARSVNSAFEFESEEGKYTWVADLKEEHAQRVANELATQFSRVGLSESEWLLLWATRG